MPLCHFLAYELGLGYWTILNLDSLICKRGKNKSASSAVIKVKYWGHACQVLSALRGT